MLSVSGLALRSAFLVSVPRLTNAEDPALASGGSQVALLLEDNALERPVTFEADFSVDSLYPLLEPA